MRFCAPRQSADSTRKTCMAELNCSDAGLEWWDKISPVYTREVADVML